MYLRAAAIHQAELNDRSKKDFLNYHLFIFTWSLINILENQRAIKEHSWIIFKKKSWNITEQQKLYKET